MRKLFPGQLAQETIYLVARQHWIILAQRVLIWLVFLGLLVVVKQYGPEYVPGLFQGSPGKIVELFAQLYLLLLVAALFIIWIIYYLNMNVVTDERIVDIDQTGLFHHMVSELNIEKVEDVTSEVKGLLGHMFDYGTVYIQTAGAQTRFDFQNVPQPGKIAKLILELYEKQTEKNGHQED
jgi:hypothetical protein